MCVRIINSCVMFGVRVCVLCVFMVCGKNVCVYYECVHMCVCMCVHMCGVCMCASGEKEARVAGACG